MTPIWPPYLAPRPVRCSSGYARIEKVTCGDEVTLTFPIAEERVTTYMEKNRYDLAIKGYEVVDIDPRGRLCPLYQRDHYRDNVTLWRKVRRFVSDESIRW